LKLPDQSKTYIPKSINLKAMGRSHFAMGLPWGNHGKVTVSIVYFYSEKFLKFQTNSKIKAKQIWGNHADKIPDFTPSHFSPFS
jgi:hypothetical protein